MIWIGCLHAILCPSTQILKEEKAALEAKVRRTCCLTYYNGTAFNSPSLSCQRLKKQQELLESISQAEVRLSVRSAPLIFNTTCPLFVALSLKWNAFQLIQKLKEDVEVKRVAAEKAAAEEKVCCFPLQFISSLARRNTSQNYFLYTWQATQERLAEAREKVSMPCFLSTSTLVQLTFCTRNPRKGITSQKESRRWD